MDNEKLSQGVAGLITDLRKRQGLSKSKMALELMIDQHTLSKWEAGASEPSVSQFIMMFDHFGESALRSVLDMIYPDIYKSLNYESEADAVRAALVHFFETTASDRAVMNIGFAIFGEHGSNFEPQLQECMMVEHLPLHYRYTIAEMIDTFWNLAEMKGEIEGFGDSMPDVELFRNGIKKARESIVEGNESYTTSMEG